MNQELETRSWILFQLRSPPSLENFFVGARILDAFFINTPLQMGGKPRRKSCVAKVATEKC